MVNEMVSLEEIAKAKGMKWVRGEGGQGDLELRRDRKGTHYRWGVHSVT